MAKTGRGGRRNRKPNKPTSSSHLSPPQTLPLPEKPTGITLPDDLIAEILCRTPVRSLLRFKCVCKHWLLRISHPKFIAMHLKTNYLKNQKLICTAYDSAELTRKLVCYLRLTQLPIPVLYVDTQLSLKLDYPRKINFFDFSKNMVLAGSVNGVVCLTHSREMLGRFVALWNPSINIWKPVSLLEPKSECDVMERMSVGLGFDAVADDFRIIRIVPVLCPLDFKEYSWSRVEIYSAKCDSWKDVGKESIIPFWPKLPNCNFVVNGVPYWVGVDGFPEDLKEFNPYRREMLGRIDPCSGLYKKVEYPEHVKNECTLVHPVKLKDSVAVLIQSPGEYANPMVDLYVLDERAANWTKLHTIGPLPFDGLRIPQCFNTGEIVLETWEGDILHADRVPFFCDPETGGVLYNNGMVALQPLWYESYSHLESLVAVKGMKHIVKEDKKKEKTKPKKKSWTESLSKDFESVLHF